MKVKILKKQKRNKPKITFTYLKMKTINFDNDLNIFSFELLNNFLNVFFVFKLIVSSLERSSRGVHL